MHSRPSHRRATVMAGSFLLAMGLGLSAQAQDPQVPEAGIRVTAQDTAFVPLPIPGASSFALYGGTGTGLATAMTSQLDPATDRVLPHTHSNGYWAMVMKGRMQHWELSEPDRGPDLLPGSYWFQPGGVPHAEDCLGPEICQVFVVFDKAADFTPFQ